MTQTPAEPRILAEPRARRPRRTTAFGALSLGQWAAVAFLGLTGVAAFGLAPGTALDLPPIRTVTMPLPVPAVDAGDDAPASVFWREERVQRGDTIGALLARIGVDDPDALQYLRTDPAAKPLYQLRPGRTIRVGLAEGGKLEALRFQTVAGDVLSIARDGDGFDAERIPPAFETRLTLRTAEIRSSLFAAADAADVPDPITVALADVFGGDIDFLRDLSRGDRFAVLYETRYLDGEPVGVGRIVAAEFENRGQVLKAFLYRHDDGTESYYNEDGRSSRKAFLRSPMELSRMTSGFSMARFHPILQQWRAHQGVDYAAPVGTPARVTADGIVTFAGVQNGYGNVVTVRHDEKYSTLYAHLSRFPEGLKTGDRVRQGDTIGYVGMTGWATGPHLHYEFRIANEPRDPMTIALPTAVPLPIEQRAAFAAYAAPLERQLSLARSMPAGALAAFE